MGGLGLPWDRALGRDGRPGREVDGGDGSGAALPPGSGGCAVATGAGEGLGRGQGEHPFPYLKPHFGYRKVRYRGLAKNTERIALLLGFEPADRGSLCHCVRGCGGGHPSGRDGNGGSKPPNARISRPWAPSEAEDRPDQRHSARHRVICRPVQTFLREVVRSSREFEERSDSIPPLRSTQETHRP